MKKPKAEQMKKMKDILISFIDEGSVIPKDEKEDRSKFISNLKQKIKEKLKEETKPNEEKPIKFKFKSIEKEKEFIEKLEQIGIEPVKEEDEKEEKGNNPTTITLYGHLRITRIWYWLFLKIVYYSSSRTEGYTPTKLKVQMDNYDFENRDDPTSIKGPRLVLNTNFVDLKDEYFSVFGHDFVIGTHECWYPWGNRYLKVNTKI